MLAAVLLHAAAAAYAAAYTDVSYIGFPMQTGYDAFVSPGGLFYGDSGGLGVYAGKASSVADIEGRVRLLGEVINTVGSDASIDRRPTTLKVFMVPEFFFRGAVGAYNMTETRVVEELARKLGGLVEDPAWSDWVFYFGTTIGFRRSRSQTNATIASAFEPRALVDTYNFVQIRRGGPSREQHIHFKKFISSIDFLDATPGVDGTVTFPEMNVSAKAGAKPRPMRHVTKRYPLLDGLALRGLEAAAGTAVDGRFTMANVSFCVDICLDHAMGVCAKALDAEKAAGTGPGLVSVHVITSAGMRIQPKHVRVPKGGSVLLADGLGAGAQQSVEKGGAAAMAKRVHAASAEEARASVGEAAVEREAKRVGSPPNMLLDDDYEGRVASTTVDVFAGEGDAWRAKLKGLFAVQRYGAPRPPWASEGSYSYDGVEDEAWAYLAEVKPKAQIFDTVPIVVP